MKAVLTFVMSDGDVLFFGRSLIVAPPSKIVDMDILEIESSDVGLVQPSSCSNTKHGNINLTYSHPSQWDLENYNLYIFCI